MLSRLQKFWLLLLPLSRQQLVSFSVFLCVAGWGYWQERVGEEPKRRKSLILCKSFNILCIKVYRKLLWLKAAQLCRYNSPALLVFERTGLLTALNPLPLRSFLPATLPAAMQCRQCVEYIQSCLQSCLTVPEWYSVSVRPINCATFTFSLFGGSNFAGWLISFMPTEGALLFILSTGKKYCYYGKQKICLLCLWAVYAFTTHQYKLFCLLLFEGTSTSVSKGEKWKISKIVEIKVFLTFCSLMEGSGSRSAKIMTDPDPQRSAVL